MKNASLVLNVVLLVAVVVLYILHFSSGKSTTTSSVAGSSGPSNLKVAYIVEDTVLKYYDYFKEKRDKLEAKAKSLESQFASRQQSLQREVQQYQETARSLTIGQAQALEADLQQKGQNLQMYQQTLSQQMAQEEGKIADELYKKVTTYLKSYSQEKGYEVILKADRGSDLLFASDSLDVSKDVIAGLNEAYKAEVKTVPARKDSTTKK